MRQTARTYRASLAVIVTSALIVASCGTHADAAARGVPGDAQRPLRYRPVDHGFAITNGGESFNRPLYGGYTGFRADAGDRPEFSLYLPGRGGVLRVGLTTSTGTKWLRDAATIEATYVNASMRYVVRDPSFGETAIRLTAVALRDTEGLAIRVDAEGLSAPATVLFAFGGANGERSRRDGDIGTEPLPVAQYFALRPEHCRGNVVDLGDAGFMLRAKSERLVGTASGGATSAKIVDARQWDDVATLQRSADARPEAPAALVGVQLTPGEAVYFVLQRLTPDAASTTQPATNVSVLRDAYGVAEVAPAFAEAVDANRAVARRVVVDTPDPFVDSAVNAMCVAADALWDESSGSVMHGGVAWRRRYLGWRGPYSGDATGRHDRTRRHLEGYFAQQNTKPIDADISGADEAEFLARSHRLIQSNGNLINSHYDMNLVAVDTFFRHLLWTGDLAWAERNWPVIERHFAWQRRNFRRDFDGLPLYEAYACIWASDDLQYNGGGVTHASAYNYYHNVMAARVASLLGKDPAPYEQEADAIRRAMQMHLWLPDRGWYAEYKDLLGERRAHPAAALWTYYHTIDSHVPDPLAAWQMMRAVDSQLPRLSIRGPGVPDGEFATLASTNWMPYTWSINNVAMAEVTHTALAAWQAGRADQAMSLWKSAILDAMYLGLCPGNLHMTSAFDAYRGESQRDSGDPVGATWRATIEGLFGIVPDAIAGELTLRPGFPREWSHASIEHPDVAYTFRREGTRDVYRITPRFGKPMRLKLRVPADGNDAAVTVNGQTVDWSNVNDAVGRPAIEINAGEGNAWEVAIDWRGSPPRTTSDVPKVAAIGDGLWLTPAAPVVEVRDPQGVLPNPTMIHGVAGKVSGTPGERTLFVRVQAEKLAWWQPIEIDVRPANEVLNATVSEGVLTFSVRRHSGRPLRSPVVVIDSNATTRPAQAVAGPSPEVPAFRVEGITLVPGTNRFTARLDDADAVFTITDWSARHDEPAKLDPLELAPHFNDRVTQIFKNRYSTPRSPHASLAMPTQGFGGWATNKTTPVIDDTGLRALGGRLVLPNGVAFRTPSEPDAKNVLFVSQWDNYPRDATIPISGRARQAYLLMAGSTNAMQSRFENGEVIVTYADGGTERLTLRNPDTWWPIDQDYYVDGHAYAIEASLPPRVDLKSGLVRLPTPETLARSTRTIPGGAATILSLPLDPRRELRSLAVRAIANEVVIGLMGVTLDRP